MKLYKNNDFFRLLLKILHNAKSISLKMSMMKMK